MSKMIELMDQWLGTHNEIRTPKIPIKPKVITFWNEYETPMKKKIKVPKFKTYYQLIKEEREMEKNKEQGQSMKIDWKKIRKERRNERQNAMRDREVGNY